MLFKLPIDEKVNGKYYIPVFTIRDLIMTPNREQELEDEIELLNQKLKALTGTSQELGTIMAIGHGMTQRLALILMILVKRAPGVVSKSTFHSLVYGHDEDGGPEPKIFSVHIGRLRSLLKRVNCPGKVDTVWNAGYRANPELVKWVKDLYDRDIPKEKSDDG